MAIRHATGSPPRKPNRIKKALAATVATGLISIGLVSATSVAAEAHTLGVTTSCEALTVDLQSYRYQPAVPAQGYTEYEWAKTITQTTTSNDSPGDGWVKGVAVAWEYVDKHGNTRWEDSATWNAQSNPESFGWKLSGQVKYQWTKTTVETQWSKDSPGTGWTKTGQSRFHETSPAQPEKTNTVVVAIDNTQVTNTTFETSFNRVYDYKNYGGTSVGHTYKVVVTAWDDPTGSRGWTQTIPGASTPCEKPFDWNWQYPAPTCTDGLAVTYPENIPAGQANDVNIKVKNLSTNEEKTFNFHNNTGTWSGTQTFNVTTRSDWPGWKYYEYEWIQVAGTNYHWTGSVTCGTQPPVANAKASVKITPATCTAPATVAPADVVNATLTSATGTTGPGNYSMTFTANPMSVFADLQPTNTFTGTLAGPIGTQSTNPSGDCYVPPQPTKVTVPTPTVVDKCDTYQDSVTGVPTPGVRYEYDGWFNEDGTFTFVMYSYPTLINGVMSTLNTEGVPTQDKLPANYVGFYINSDGVLTYTVVTQNQPCSPQPPDRVVVTPGTPVCGVNTVDDTIVTTSSVWNAVTSTWDDTVKTTKSTRPLTDKEKAALNCSTTSPSPTPSTSTSPPAATPSATPVAAPVAKPSTTPTQKPAASLASTGANVTSLAWVIAGLFVVGGVFITLAGFAGKRRRHNQA